MNSTFTFKGQYQIKPPPTKVDLSGDFEIVADILETLAVSKRVASAVTLVDAVVEPLNMADITRAAVIIVKSDKPVTVRLTTAAGVAQALGGVTFMVLLCAADPVTAVTMQGALGSTECRILLAEV